MQKLNSLLLLFNFILLVGLLFLGLHNLNKINLLINSQNNKIASQNSQTTSNKPVDGYFQYINSYHKAKMKYPEDWTKSEYDNSVFVEFKKLPFWDFNIVSEYLTSNPSLEEYKTKALKLVEGYKNYKLIESGETTLANLPAFTLVFTATFDKDYKIKQVYTIKQNHGYSLTYRAPPGDFDTELPNADKMMTSFEIITE